MQPTRRRMMLTMSGVAAAALALRPLWPSAAAQAHAGPPQPMPSPNAPVNQNVPIQIDQADIPVRGPGHPIPPATWKEIKDDALKLYQMAAGFATQVDNTDVAAVLPLPLLKEVREIEKLAKQIQNRMRS